MPTYKNKNKNKNNTQQQQLDTTFTNGSNTEYTTSAYQSNVAIVPCVVIHQRGAVGHACNLVTIVPPAHHTGLTVCVLSQPVVRFSEIIKDLPRPAAWQKKVLCGEACSMYGKQIINSFTLMASRPNWKRMPERHKKKSRQNQHKTGSNEACLTLFRPRADMHCLPLNHKKICIFNESSVCALHMDDS